MGLRVNLKKKVNGFELEVEWQIEDDLAVLFGTSGAGKSLTLQMIAGLVKPDEGVVGLNGKTFFDNAAGVDLPPYARSFGYVFQDLALFPHMTVRNNILFGAPRVHKIEKKERAGQLIETFGLSGLEERYPCEISGGQKQRVAFARALIGRPEALLLDEPFSALDQALRFEMRRFLLEVKVRFGIPVILVTHDFEEAFLLADKIIVYSHGKVVQAGPLREVMECPVSSEVSALVNAKKELIISPIVG